jgi:hypothetical protein
MKCRVTYPGYTWIRTGEVVTIIDNGFPARLSSDSLYLVQTYDYQIFVIDYQYLSPIVTAYGKLIYECGVKD